MAEDFELFGGAPGGKEKVQESDEHFQERYRQAQSQIKQIKKDESKHKRNDNQLAKVIVRFLGQKNHTSLFLLISKLIAADVPSDLILAVISLIDNDCADLIAVKVAEGNLQIQSAKVATAAISKSNQERVAQWGAVIGAVAFSRPVRNFQAIVDQEQKIRLPLLQLTAFVLREFLENFGENVNFENVKSFCMSLWHSIAQGAVAKIQPDSKNLPHSV